MISAVKGALVFNLLIVISECCGFVMIKDLGVGMFVYFTQLSNLLALISSLLYALFLLKKKDKKEIPSFVLILRYMTTCLLTITFLVAAIVLSAGGGFVSLMIKGGMLFHHTLCPILSVLSFVLFEGDKRYNKKKLQKYAFLPVLAYALVFIILNLAKIYEGPYQFFLVYQQPVWMSAVYFIGIVGGAFLISRILLYLNQRYSRR